MRDYKNLEFWKLAHELAVEIYQISESFPKEEKYGITNQLKRAALSIPTNIVEGCGRESKKEFKRFLNISNGSASEVEYLLFFSFELEFLNSDNFKRLNNKVLYIKKCITSYKNKITVD